MAHNSEENTLFACSQFELYSTGVSACIVFSLIHLLKRVRTLNLPSLNMLIKVGYIWDAI